MFEWFSTDTAFVHVFKFKQILGAGVLTVNYNMRCASVFGWFSDNTACVHVFKFKQTSSASVFKVNYSIQCIGVSGLSS
ncbi:hypothetical protein HYC85_029059 [Camellia sinensis]|uniref:Uncharacterized protein n=1 Tax=Camellia sinensis TaxID=4442 RepID=A0A7J7FZ82_CAMSI|nr:hypothetical protein HYC85_029059 [Camellia sinensis]